MLNVRVNISTPYYVECVEIKCWHSTWLWLLSPCRLFSASWQRRQKQRWTRWLQRLGSTSPAWGCPAEPGFICTDLLRWWQGAEANDNQTLARHYGRLDFHAWVLSVFLTNINGFNHYLKGFPLSGTLLNKLSSTFSVLLSACE